MLVSTFTVGGAGKGSTNGFGIMVTWLIWVDGRGGVQGGLAVVLIGSVNAIRLIEEQNLKNYKKISLILF